MSCEKFDPKCPSCRPVLLDPKTGRTLLPNDPMMVTINAVWEESSIEDKEAFWRVTVKNSRVPGDLERLKVFQERFSAKLHN